MNRLLLAEMTAAIFMVLLSPDLHASVRCEDIFFRVPSAPAKSVRELPKLQIDKSVPATQRRVIAKSLDAVMVLARDLKLPEKIEIVVDEQASFVGAIVRFTEGRLEISKNALSLSEAEFETLMVHELTHFIVPKNFRTPGSKENSPDLFEGLRQDDDAMVAISMHIPYAELLCDVASVLTSRRPTAFRDLVDELSSISAGDPKVLDLIKQAQADQPTELSVRDFSLSHEDPRWENYQPRELTYNRFNQIRSYLWHKWVRNLPPEQAPHFFARLVRGLEPIYRSGQLDMTMSMTSVHESNQALMQYLDTALAEH